jgi:predicted site-specific integrase-resolvase
MRRYTDDGRFADVRSPGGRRIFRLAVLERARHAPGGGGRGSGVVVYARVSSRRQQAEGDLDRQMRRVAATAGDRLVHTFTDVASGLGDNRPGLRRALGACCTDEAVGVLMVEHPDRPARFGVRVIEHMLAFHGVQVSYVGEPEDGVSAEAELVRDMLAVVTSFAGRLYGQRSAKTKRLTAVLRQESGAS